MDKQASLVFEADIPAHMRRGCAATMMVVLTESQSSTISQVSVEDSKQSESQSSSSNTLQVPDYAYQAECFDEPRRRSLSSLQTEETTFRNSRQDRRASAPPVRRASCVWGQIWDLRDLLSRKRKFSASSSDYQVRPTKILFSFYIVLMNLFGDLCQFSKLRKLLFVIVGRIAKLVLHQPSVSASCVWGQIWDLRECFGEPHWQSLSSHQTEETIFQNSRQDRRASAPPVRRASCVWGKIWDMHDLLSRSVSSPLHLQITTKTHQKLI